MPNEPLTAEQAHAIYDVLVRLAGADMSDRVSFVAAQTADACGEYRFGGLLGFGGKFRRDGSGSATGERWYVDAYPETTMAQPQLWGVINRTNTALAELRRWYEVDRSGRTPR